MALDDIVMGGIKKGTHIANLGGLTGSFKATAERIKEGKGPSDRGTFDQDLMRAIIGFNGEEGKFRIWGSREYSSKIFIISCSEGNFCENSA